MTEHTLETAAPGSPSHTISTSTPRKSMQNHRISKLRTSIDSTALHVIRRSAIVLHNLLGLSLAGSVGAALVAAVERREGDAVAARLAGFSNSSWRWAWRSFGHGRGSGDAEADAEHGKTEEGEFHVDDRIGWVWKSEYVLCCGIG